MRIKKTYIVLSFRTTLDAMADTASYTLNDLRKKIRATENRDVYKRQTTVCPFRMARSIKESTSGSASSTVRPSRLHSILAEIGRAHV